MTKTIHPARLSGTIAIPGSKSHTIRALLIAALAEGESRIDFPLVSSDALSCLAAVEALGASILRSEDDQFWIVKGTGGQLKSNSDLIDVGNSGTTLYLATALAALSEEPVRFTGDKQIQRRSAGSLLKSLEDLGARVTRQNGDCAPFTIQGPLTGGTTSIECPTSQYLSALLLACPLARQPSVINVPLLQEQPYVEMTLRWLDGQKTKYKNHNFSQFEIPGNQSYTKFSLPIPGDFSSAAFFFCAAAITGSTLTLTNLDLTDSQGDKHILELLETMGCLVNRSTTDKITITGPARGTLKAMKMDLNAMPDALPVLAVVAAYAEGITRIHNVAHARLKETDRIAVMAHELKKLNVRTEELPDGLIIHGKGPEALSSGCIDGHDDHRIVMAFAIGALAASGPVSIETAEAASVTFPRFFEYLDHITIRDM